MLTTVKHEILNGWERSLKIRFKSMYYASRFRIDTGFGQVTRVAKQLLK